MKNRLAAGNWKMNGTRADLAEISALAAAHDGAKVDILICPPATLITAATELSGDIAIGAQDCHPAAKGAHTGDLSGSMLADAGASAVILGHSERRADHGEDDDLVAQKAAAAHEAGLTAIICVGESLAQREAGEALDVIAAQMAGSIPGTATATNTVIAYEPCWAIGTGLTPTGAQIGEVHGAMRAILSDRMGRDSSDVRLLYGGSVKGKNAPEIFAIPDVDGALVGGASLKEADFTPIINALKG